MLIYALLAVAAVFAVLLAVRLGMSARAGASLRFGWKAMAALGLGAVLCLVGRPLVGFVFISAGLVLAWPPHSVAEERDVQAARALLGVGPEANADAIRAAFRAKISSAHPDNGGTAEAVQAITAARDLLLKQVQRRI